MVSVSMISTLSFRLWVRRSESFLCLDIIHREIEAFKPVFARYENRVRIKPVSPALRIPERPVKYQRNSPLLKDDPELVRSPVRYPSVVVPLSQTIFTSFSRTVVTEFVMLPS